MPQPRSQRLRALSRSFCCSESRKNRIAGRPWSDRAGSCEWVSASTFRGVLKERSSAVASGACGWSSSLRSRTSRHCWNMSGTCLYLPTSNGPMKFPTVSVIKPFSPAVPARPQRRQPVCTLHGRTARPTQGGGREACRDHAARGTRHISAGGGRCCRAARDARRELRDIGGCRSDTQ